MTDLNRSISFLTYNVNGLMSKLNCTDFVELMSNYDIICLTETFLEKTIESSVFEKYDMFFSKATKLSHRGRHSGGVLVLVKKCLDLFVERIDVDVENTVVMKLSKRLFRSDKDIMFISTYIPPYDSSFWLSATNGYGMELLDKCIMDLHDRFDDFQVLLCGDMNARTADKNYSGHSLETEGIEDVINVNNSSPYPRKSQDKGENSFGTQLLEFCDIFDCLIVNGLTSHGLDNSHTYICKLGASVVDYFVMSCELFDSLCDVRLVVKELVESDHLPLELSFSVHAESSNEPEKNRESGLSKGERIVWSHDREAEFKETFHGEESKLLLESAACDIDVNVNDALDKFVNCLKIASQCMVKKFSTAPKFRNAAWLDKECAESKRTCKKKLKTFRRTRSDSKRRDYVEQRRTYKKLLKKKKKDYGRQTAECLAKNIKNSLFWSEVKKLGGRKRSQISDKICIDDWYDHFKNVFKLCDEARENHQRGFGHIDDNEEDPVLNLPINQEEVRKSIKNLKNGKACGTDGIVSEMLKAGGQQVILFLTKLFNRIFESGIPSEWAKAIVIPIFKKGNVDQPDNYRGVSLISIICKCYTSILNDRLRRWLEEKDVIVENQAGFRKHYSTSDQIFNLYAIVQKCFSKSKKLYVAFVDFKKAFDSVRHDKLLEAISSLGMNGKFVVSLKAMYDSLISCVRVNNVFSEFFECPVGVRQGCVLSPTLFSLFINQLANHVNEVGVHGIQLLPNLVELFILLFADDVALLSSTPGGLQVQLNALKQCCDNLKLSVNKDKTKIMVFRKGGFLAKHEKWVFEGKEIEVVNSYCYLGYTFSTKLSVIIGTRHLVTKAKKAVFLLCRAFQNCKEMSQDIFFKLFDAKVQSIVLYSSEIWGLQRLECIERVHLLACKRFLGVSIRSPNKMVYGELGRYPLFVNSFVRAVKYWLRLLQMDIHRLPKQAYLMQLSMDKDGKKCWVSDVRTILCEYGFHFVWLNQGVANEKGFLSSFRQRMIDVFIQEWSASVRDRDRYVLFRKAKGLFEKEMYLVDIDAYHLRSTFTRFRFGVLPIYCNLRRYSENPREKMCPFCESLFEDEEHLFYKCPIYVDLRMKLLDGYRNRPLHQLMDGKNIQLSILVAKFVFFAMKRREKYLELCMLN